MTDELKDTAKAVEQEGQQVADELKDTGEAVKQPEETMKKKPAKSG